MGATSPRLRADILRKAFELATTKYRDDLALIMTLEMGKPLDQAQGEVTYGAEFLRWFSEEATRIRGDYFRVPEGHLQALVVRRPVGPCLLCFVKLMCAERALRSRPLQLCSRPFERRVFLVIS